MKTLIHSVDIVESGRRLPGAWALLDPSGVVATGQTTPWQDVAGDATHVIDAREVAGEGALLTPGFIDIHGHGGAGVSYDDGAEAIRAARAMHRLHGTTRAVISLVTASLDALEAEVSVVRELMRTDGDILGTHLEGPFLDLGHKGAHEAALLRAPELTDVQRLLDAGAGTVRQVTIAPELPGGIAAVSAIVAAGAVAAVGHTNASADIASEAFDAGATLITHAFNAMPGIHHREPGPVVAAASDPRVSLELIADGVHVDLNLIRMIFASAPGRIVLVTDAMAAAGSGDGSYILGALGVTVTDGIARLTDGGAIAGSTLTQDVALQNVVSAGVPLEGAVDALTINAARVLGLGEEYGRLREGCVADAVLLDRELNVRAVWVDGQRPPVR